MLSLDVLVKHAGTSTCSFGFVHIKKQSFPALSELTLGKNIGHWLGNTSILSAFLIMSYLVDSNI